MIKLWTLSKWFFFVSIWIFSFNDLIFWQQFCCVFNAEHSFTLHDYLKPDIYGKWVKKKFKLKEMRKNSVQFNTHSFIESVKRFINKTTKIWLKGEKRKASQGINGEKKHFCPFFNSFVTFSRANGLFIWFFVFFWDFSLSHSNFTIHTTTQPAHLYFLFNANERVNYVQYEFLSL